MLPIQEETFNVTYTSMAQTVGLHKLTLPLQGGPETQTVNLCLCVAASKNYLHIQICSFCGLLVGYTIFHLFGPPFGCARVPQKGSESVISP